MKVGDKVKVIELDTPDMEDTNLEMGVIGVITGIEQEHPSLFCVDFGEQIRHKEGTPTHNFKPNGYFMFGYQLELVE